jgi:hypothetical protein
MTKQPEDSTDLKGDIATKAEALTGTQFAAPQMRADGAGLIPGEIIW